MKNVEACVLLSLEAMGIFTFLTLFLDGSVNPIILVPVMFLCCSPLVLLVFTPEPFNTLQYFHKHSGVFGVLYVFDAIAGVYTLLDLVPDYGTVACILNFVCCYVVMDRIVEHYLPVVGCANHTDD